CVGAASLVRDLDSSEQLNSIAPLVAWVAWKTIVWPSAETSGHNSIPISEVIWTSFGWSSLTLHKSDSSLAPAQRIFAPSGEMSRTSLPLSLTDYCTGARPSRYAKQIWLTPLRLAL